MDGGTISDNEAQAGGGGVYTNNGGTMNGGLITGNNRSGGKGGGLYIGDGPFTVAGASWGSRINGNTATGVGRQVYKENGSFTDSSGTVGSPTGNDGIGDYWD
jgi:hypothetical protein